MKWKGRRQSDNVVDLGSGGAAPRGKKAAVGGGIGVILVAAVVMLMNGGDLSQVLSMFASEVNGGGAQSESAGQVGGGGTIGENTPKEEELLAFVKTVLADTEDVWIPIFDSMGERYVLPKLHRFRDAVDSACGRQTSAVGPFYCGADQNIYLDLEFFDDLDKRHDAAGDFAQAYVIAHEVAHHIQNILGISSQVGRQKQTASESVRNQLSVRQELHADYLAGVWTHHVQRTKNVLEPGDLEEALNAAWQIGDDALQRRAGVRVRPHAFTHGTSAQRQKWFKAGFDTGDMSAGLQLYELEYSRL